MSRKLLCQFVIKMALLSLTCQYHPHYLPIQWHVTIWLDKVRNLRETIGQPKLPQILICSHLGLYVYIYMANVHERSTHYSLNPNKEWIFRDMEGCKKLFLVALVLALAILSEPMVANAQTLCRMTKEDLKACEPSVNGPNPAPPSAPCCSALSNADMQCLCLFKNSRLLNLYGIDPNLALALPSKCNLPQTRC